ncbi:MAG: porin [Neisseriaceae bacterium]|nr:porin [Neisseriaceae bacterium]
MKKTLIALTLAALPVASMAEVTLFGTIKGGLEVTKVKGVKNTVTNANDWDSSIGFKGEEDLGNGLKAIWQLQSKASIDNKSGRNGQRNTLTSFIGLDAGAFGKVRAGHLPDAIKDMGDLNLDASGHGVRALDAHWERTGRRHTALRYDTANIAGFSANLLYSMEDNQRYDQARNAGFKDLTGLEEGLECGKAKAADCVGQDVDGVNAAQMVNVPTRNSWVASVGLNYTIAGFFVKYGYVHQNDKDDVYNAHVHRLIGGYDANNIFVGLGYQHAYGFDGPKVKNDEIVLAAAYRIGNVVPRFTYAHGFKERKAAPGAVREMGTRYDQVTLGVDYHLSKRTTVISTLGWMKEGAGRVGDNYIGTVLNDDGTQRTKEQAYSFGLGLSHKF